MTTVFYSVAEKYIKNLIYSAYAFELNAEDSFDRFFIVVNDNVNTKDLKQFFIDKTQTRKSVDVIYDKDAFIKLNFETDEHKKYIINNAHYYQQIFKIHADILTGDTCLCITDPDAFVLKPFNFLKDGKTVVNHIVNWYNDEYGDIALNLTIPKYFFNNDGLFTNYHFQTELMPTNDLFLKELRRFLKDLIKRSPEYSFTTNIDPLIYNTIKGPKWPDTPPSNFYELPNFILDELLVNNWQPYFEKSRDERKSFAEWSLHAHFLCRYYKDSIHLNPLRIKVNRITVDIKDNDFDIYKDWANHDDEAFYAVFRNRYSNFSI